MRVSSMGRPIGSATSVRWFSHSQAVAKIAVSVGP
jgi:hypothetical protein